MGHMENDNATRASVTVHKTLAPMGATSHWTQFFLCFFCVSLVSFLSVHRVCVSFVFSLLLSVVCVPVLCVYFQSSEDLLPFGA